MDAKVHGATLPVPLYEISGRTYELGEPGFADAVADAHAVHDRPRCLCQPGGVEMYVARLAGQGPGFEGGFIVKRMPDTGSLHAAACTSYEPPADLSGLGQVLGSAITEDPATGETTLKLDFALTKMPGRAGAPSAGMPGESVSTVGTRLSLRGLLHYLWDQAELTRWQPGFAGKRTWGTVRRHLLQAAENKLAKGNPLRSRLYIPEVFSVDQRDAINARRRAAWAAASRGEPAAAGASASATLRQAPQGQPLLLLIGEVKEIVPARYGYKAVIKHVPDLGFALDEVLYRRLGRHFEAELALWGASDRLHMVVIGTFSVNAAGLPTLVTLSLMPVTAQWLPVEDAFELALVDRLANDGRSFVKGLRYNLAQGDAVASAVLTDVPGSPVPLLIAKPDADSDAQNQVQQSLGGCRAEDSVLWIWHVVGGEMPELPHPARSG